MAALATVTDVAARLGRTLTTEESSRVTAALEDVSAAIRAYTGQQITPGTSTVRLQNHYGDVVLPQRPVTAVTAVRTVTGEGVEEPYMGYSYIAGQRVRSLPPGWVEVDYTHGYEAVPDEIKSVACQVVLRWLPNPTGIRGEVTGPFSVTYAIPATGVPMGLILTRDEKKVLDRYAMPRAGVVSLL